MSELFANGKAEWARWIIAVLVGGSIQWGITTARMDSLEQRQAQQDAALNEAVRAMREDLREVRTVLYRAENRTTIIDGVETAPSRALPQFPRDQRFASQP